MQLSEWLPADLKLDGVANASVELQLHELDTLRGKARIELPAGNIQYPLLEGDLEQWEYRSGLIDIELNAQGLEVSSEIAMKNGDQLDGELRLAGFNALDLDIQNSPVQASARLKVLDLSAIEVLIPEISKPKGDLAVNISTSGTLSEPRLVMDIQLLDASLQIPRMGLNIEQINLKSQSEDFEKLKFQINAQSGKGSLVILGETKLDYKSGWPTEVSIKGQEFEVSRIPEARVLVSPDLTIVPGWTIHRY